MCIFWLMFRIRVVCLSILSCLYTVTAVLFHRFLRLVSCLPSSPQVSQISFLSAFFPFSFSLIFPLYLLFSLPSLSSLSLSLSMYKRDLRRKLQALKKERSNICFQSGNHQTETHHASGHQRRGPFFLFHFGCHCRGKKRSSLRGSCLEWVQKNQGLSIITAANTLIVIFASLKAFGEQSQLLTKELQKMLGS